MWHFLVYFLDVGLLRKGFQTGSSIFSHMKQNFIYVEHKFHLFPKDNLLLVLGEVSNYLWGS
jgi:hypothetical protein